jgi:hypothetical protein
MIRDNKGRFVKGNIFPDEIKNKIRETLVLKNIKPKVFKGMSFTESHRKNLSIARSGRFRGTNSPTWNGMSPLKKLIRYSRCNKEWSRKVLERDDFSCQECGKRGCKLQAHHIVSFNTIFLDFIKLHDYFSPYEDKDTLSRIADYYEPFWDISNGKALCIECHKKTDNFNRKIVCTNKGWM